jgi:integrase
MRHSFATWALHAGLSIFDLSRFMGTSVEMIDRTYGHLAHGAEQTAREKLDAVYAKSVLTRSGHGRERGGRLEAAIPHEH